MNLVNTHLQFMTLEYAKAHLRLDSDIEDDELTMLLAAAEQEALRFMERDLSSLIDEYGSVPADICKAILCRVATSYENRGETTSKAVNPLPANSWDNILVKYINPYAL